MIRQYVPLQAMVAAVPSDGSLLVRDALEAINRRTYNIDLYGGVADERNVSDAGMTNGSAVLTSATAAFTSADVGKLVYVGGAGTAGATLKTTVSSYTSATQVTLANAASTTVTNRPLYIGTDNTPAIAAALAGASAGSSIYIPPGRRLVNTRTNTISSLFHAVRVATSNMRIYGEGDVSVLVGDTMGQQHFFLVGNSTLVESATTPTDVRFDHFKVEGVVDAGNANYIGSETNLGMAVYVYGYQVTLDHVTAYRTGGLQGGAALFRGTKIEACYVNEFAATASRPTKDTTILGTVFIGIVGGGDTSHAIYTPDGLTDLVAAGCIYRNIPGVAVHAYQGSVGSGQERVVISNSSFHNNLADIQIAAPPASRSYALIGNSHSSTAGTVNIIIDRCESVLIAVSSFDAGSSSGRSAIQVRGHANICKNITMKGNQFDRYDDAIIMDGVLPIAFWTITNNDFFNCTRGVKLYMDRNSAGALGSAPTDGTIANNYFQGGSDKDFTGFIVDGFNAEMQAYDPRLTKFRIKLGANSRKRLAGTTLYDAFAPHVVAGGLQVFSEFTSGGTVDTPAASSAFFEVAYQKRASATITVATPIDGDTVTIQGVVFTARTAATLANEFTIGATNTDTATNLAAIITASASSAVDKEVLATASAAIVTLTAQVGQTTGNAYTLTSSGATLAVSGATFSGGVNSTQRFYVSETAAKFLGPVNGTSDILTLLDSTGASEYFLFDPAGIPRWRNSANVQTTVGGVGGAAAPPATPAKYLKVKDNAGTTYVIPAYAAS